MEIKIKAISPQQIGVENKIPGSPEDRVKERLKPLYPMGPRIKASTTAAGLRLNLRIK